MASAGGFQFSTLYRRLSCGRFLCFRLSASACLQPGCFGKGTTRVSF